VVDEVVVNVMSFAFYQINAGQREGRYLTVVHFESGVFGLNAARSRKLIVILMPAAAFAEEGYPLDSTNRNL